MTTTFRTHFTFRVDTWTPHAKALSSTSLASRTTGLHSLPTARCVNVGPARPSPGAAGQTRVVSMAGIRLGSGESARAFKGIICDDISEFESHMPSHPVVSNRRSAKEKPRPEGASSGGVHSERSRARDGQ